MRAQGNNQCRDPCTNLPSGRVARGRGTPNGVGSLGFGIGVRPGKHHDYWELDGPAGKTLEDVRPIRDEIRDRVTSLLDKLAST
jgi:hypothetical protein